MSKINVNEHLRHEATRLLADLQRNFPAVREIMFTGCAGQEGVTSLAIALARAVVRQRRARVLLVDANFGPKNQGLTRMVGGWHAQGLRDLMQLTESAEDGALLGSVFELENGIEVFTRGIAQNVELADLESAGALGAFRDRALENYDFVFWDVEPINFSPDAKLLLSEVLEVILVVQSDVTRIDHFNSSIAEIRQVRANLLAVLRNRAGQRAFSVGADQQ